MSRRRNSATLAPRRPTRPRGRGRDPRPPLALALFAVAALSLVGYVALTWHGSAMAHQTSQTFDRLAAVGFLVYVLVGASIVVRRPANGVGWILGSIGFFPLLGAVAGEHAARALADDGTSGLLQQQAQWLSVWSFYPVLGAMPLLFLLFPDGRTAWRSARHLVRLGVVTLTTVVVIAMFTPSDGDHPLENPYAVPVPHVVDVAVGLVVVTSLLVSLAAGLASLAVRYRRAHGVERQQVTCLLYTAVLGVCLFFVPRALPGEAELAIAFTLPALGVGAAVLRYRLYDIDRLVSRTVSYALLSALIALPYVLVVAGTSRLGSGSSATVVLATLAAAAAFSPLRRRIQDRVDRRFNRSRYDAARTVQAFTDRLRQEVDLDTVRTDLLAVVHSTVQPATASLWLRSRQQVGSAR